jgi:hypothetical protein
MLLQKSLRHFDVCDPALSKIGTKTVAGVARNQMIEPQNKLMQRL